MKRSGCTWRRLVPLLPAAGAAATPIHADGVLWQVQGPEGTDPSHVFGTIHSDDPRVLDLDPAIERAFRSSGHYAFELDFDADIRQTMTRAMFDRAPPTLAEQLGEDDWQRARRVTQARGVPENALQSMEPWALAITLSVPAMDPAATLDRVLFRRATDLGRPVRGLETVGEQLSLFDELPEREQLDLLRATLDLAEQDGLAPMFESLTAAWLRKKRFSPRRQGRQGTRRSQKAECGTRNEASALGGTPTGQWLASVGPTSDLPSFFAFLGALARTELQNA